MFNNSKRTNYESLDNSINHHDHSLYENKSNIFSSCTSFHNLVKISNNSFSFLKPYNDNFNLNNPSLDMLISLEPDLKLLNKNFPCSFIGCKKFYKSKENLTLHFKNIHLKEKPYSCKYCKSVFSHRNGKYFIYITIL